MASSTTMKAVVITTHGSYDVLQVRDVPLPEPQRGEVRVKVHAVGLNFAEVMARMGLYPEAPPPPCIVGYEASGVIEKLGEGASEFQIGERVIILKKFGTHAEYVTVPEFQALRMPENMSFEEGAALPVNYLTAYHMLMRVGNLRPQEKVLIHMAAGGVGIAALQLCRTIEGVETFGTASKQKHETIKEHGCTHPIDYRSADYVAEVKQLTNGKGVDIVLDPLGGEDNKKNFDLLKPMGRLILFGAANMVSGDTRSLFNLAKQYFKMPKFSPFDLIGSNKVIAGVNMGTMFKDEDALKIMKSELIELLQMYNDGKIKPLVDQTYPFEKAGEAHRRIQERSNVGKIVLIPTQIANNTN